MYYYPGLSLTLALPLLLLGSIIHATQTPPPESSSQKTFLFGASIGAHTHAPPMLSIAHVLADPTHNHSVHYAAYQDTEILVQSSPIHFHSIGSNPLPMEAIRQKLKDLHTLESSFSPSWLSSLSSNRWISALFSHITTRQIMHLGYPHAYQAFRRLLLQLSPDSVICDSMAESCIDAASSLNLPLVIFSPLSNIDGISHAPYTSHHLSPLPITLSPSTSPPHPPSRSLPLPLPRLAPHKTHGPLRPRWSNASILINSWVGYEPPLPLPPNARWVGPLRRSESTSPYALNNTFSSSSSSPSLPDPLDSFLKPRSSVLYISFGTNAIPTSHIIRLIFQGSHEAINAGLIDGVIWSLGNINFADLENYRPNPPLPSSPDLLILPSTPQIALLRHPTIRVFWGHCGVSSTIEAILSGLPLIMTPFFCDQLKTAAQLESIGISKSLDKDLTSVQQLLDSLYWAIHSPNSASSRAIHTALAKSASKAGMFQAISIIESSAIAGPSFSAIPPTPSYSSLLLPLFLFLITGSLLFTITTP
ncbi:MAG: hypothetical protein DHS80DRAFT_21602 [Piptocephalis tieghemiana]|nr:MAG: hypothetical protein DHS80DRAFT_21602 [Piptocephalis tieghemiana]